MRALASAAGAGRLLLAVLAFAARIPATGGFLGKFFAFQAALDVRDPRLVLAGGDRRDQ